MKFLSRLGLFLLILVLVYGGLLWKIGGEADKNLLRVSQEMERFLPTFSVVEREFDRGVFSSKETISWAVQTPDSYDFDGGSRKIPVFKTETVVKHGPFPGFRLALATTDTRVFPYDPTVQQIVNGFFKGKAPLRITTKIPLFGAVQGNATIPALKMELVPGEGINWKGLNADFWVAKSLDEYFYDMTMPSFVVESRSEHMSFSGVKAKGHATRVFEDLPYFYVGKGEGSIDVIQMDMERHGMAFDLIGLESDADSEVANGLLAASFKLKAAVLNLAGVGLENLSMDLAFEGVDARMFAEFHQSLMEYSGRLHDHEEIMEAFGGDDPFGKLSALFPTSSSIQLRELLASNEGGDVRLKGSFDLGAIGSYLQTAKTSDAAEEGLDKLSGELLFEGSKEAVLIFAGEVAKEDFGSEKEAQNFISDTIDAFVGQGLIQVDQGILKTRVLLQGGIVTMNGTAVDSTVFKELFATDDDDIDDYDME